MAGVISISSDEESSDESAKHSVKKLKIEDIICLDDDDEKNKVSDIVVDEKEVVTQKNEITKEKRNEESIENDDDIVIQLDDDITEVSKTTATTNEVKINGDKSVKKDDCKSSDNVADMFEKSKKMQEFVKSSISVITNEDTKRLFISKLLTCKQLFDKVGDDYITSNDFEMLLDDKILVCRKSSLIAITSFNDIYQHLKGKLRNGNAGASTSTDISTSKHQIIIAKLEHALRKVQKVLVKLEEAEVDFDQEDDSSYIKMQRYRERAVKIYEKLCKYKNEDANANNILYNRLDFSGSPYPEFNHVINRKFKNNTVFPTYYEVERILRKTMNDKNMNLTDSTFKHEAAEVFKNLGNLLQKRRKLDLLNIHSSYLETTDDPAYENEELEKRLRINSKDAKSKIDDICEKYVRMQESGVTLELSSDSDDSNKESSEDEENEK